MRCLGVDPDTRCTAFAVVEDGKFIGAWVARSPAGGIQLQLAALADIPLAFQVGSPWFARAAVERPHIAGRTHARPDDLLALSLAAGGAGAVLQALGAIHPQGLFLPTPGAWKGQVPKHIQQARTCRRLGWEPEIRATGRGRYCVPHGLAQGVWGVVDLRTSDWKHVMDAVGLALWAEAQ